MYLVRTSYDSSTAYTASTWQEAQHKAEGWAGATITECDDIYYGDNFDGWLPVNACGVYFPTGERVG